MENKKPKVAIISLTCCEGCQFAILDLGEALLDLTNHIDFALARLVEEDGDYPDNFDLGIIEGTPVTTEDIERAKKLRKQSKYIMALGACAHNGGVLGIKNYRDKEKLVKYSYPDHPDTIENPDIKGVHEIIKVDYTIPGCPIEKLDFAKTIYRFLAKHKLLQNSRPVCYECQLKENKCLLQEGKPCLGPATQGGCDAICLDSNQYCEGCRGAIKNPNLDNLKKILSDKEFESVLEKFNLKHDENKD